MRRLVYSRTGNGLFRLYGEIDPAFSRILRNVKLALQALKQFEERDRFGEVYVSPLFCTTLEHLPAFEPPELECALCAECTGAESVPEMMGKIALFLRRQEERSRLVPLMLVASTIRAVYESRNRPQLVAHVEPECAGDEGPVLVSAACAEVKADMRRSYTERKQVAEDIYEWYFAVIAESLLERLAVKNGDAASYYHLLRSYLPELTVDEYRKKHRSRLEYLGSLVQKRLRGMVAE
jgi:hypothetical protein